jgi:MFS family permease
MCGYLIAMFGWESVYYVTAALGFLWYVAWMLLVYDTPAEHPTISERERIYIESCVIKTSQSKSNPVRETMNRKNHKNSHTPYAYDVR